MLMKLIGFVFLEHGRIIATLYIPIVRTLIIGDMFALLAFLVYWIAILQTARTSPVGLGSIIPSQRKSDLSD